VFAYILHKEEAVELGIKFFYSGRPCKNGHHSPRYTRTHMCLDCRRMHEGARIKANPSAHRAKANKWYGENLEKARTAARVRERNKRTKKAESGSHTHCDIIDILRLQKGRCGYCRVRLSDKYHVDHIVPLKRGGSNMRSNLQILCQPCNQTKSAKDPIAFAQSLGKLL